MLSANDIVKHVKETIATQLSIMPASLVNSDNLFKLGVDSMQMMTLLNALKEYDINIRLRDLYQNPTLAEIQKTIESQYDSSNQAIETVTTGIDALPLMTDGQVFPMTAVQHAYYVGRSSSQPLGGVGCHLYQEFNGQGLSAEALNIALTTLIQRHPMLNVIFLQDGHQQWQETVIWQGCKVHNFCNQNSQEQEDSLFALREKTSHRRLNVEQGQCFDIQLVLLPDNRHRLIVDIDLLVMDASSFSLFFSELSDLLSNKVLLPALNNYDFCRYLAHAEQHQKTVKQQAENYWQARIEDLPAAPALPLAIDPATIEYPEFTRYRQAYNKSDWEQLKILAADHQVTPTMVLATVFSLVLSRWGGQERLLLNLTLFDCLPLHEHIQKMLADFTNIVLLDVNVNFDSLGEMMQALQHHFAEVYEHRSVSGVDVLRELKKQDSHPHGAPVVFTSNLGRSLYGDTTEAVLGELGWGISQTPQVWIDFVAYEHQNKLYLQWDCNKALFPEGMLDHMFTTFNQLVSLLIQDPQLWSMAIPDILPLSQQQLRQQYNNQTIPLSDALLHDYIVEKVQQRPDAIALVYDDQSTSYHQLLKQSQCIAQALVVQGIKPGDHVAISMDKSPGQVISVLGILLSGGVYVPVPPNQPKERRQQIYHSASIQLVITCEHEQENYIWPEGAHYICWQQANQQYSPISTADIKQRRVSAKDEAYIIYTSGSTGTPKGVVISHEGALNTCVDINQRHQITSNDRVLGLSALHFDLSVYDIFGVLSAGGTLVLPKEIQRRDPNAWCQLIQTHQVSLWNTVPALFDMLITFSEGLGHSAPQQLRVVMLSGDWIGLTLPERYHRYNPQGKFSAMGGATEASIWSNEFIVGSVDTKWRSIPYGFPLSNQAYRVVDDLRRDCPDWVPGELWIGGVGVALGYCNNPEQTQAQFISQQSHDKTERWYRTGDMGCYRPDGSIEFLGRKDNQVKIGGYRIELGEVDAGIQRIVGIKEGLAQAIGDRDKQLIAFIVLEPYNKKDKNQNHSLYESVKMPPALDGALNHFNGLFPSISKKSQDYSEQRYQVVTSLIKSFLQEKIIPFANDITKDFMPLLAKYQLFTQQTLDKVVDIDDTLTSLIEQPFFDHQDTLLSILQGELSPEVLLDTSLSPEQLLLSESDNADDQKALADVIKKLSQQLQRPITLVEYGCRSGLHAQRLLNSLEAHCVQYVGFEHSLTLVKQAEQRLANKEYARIYKIEAKSFDEWSYKADIILINNQLHAATSPKLALQQASHLAAPGAMIMVLEVAKASPLTLVSADILSRATPPKIMDKDHWCQLFEEANLQLQQQWQSGDHYAFILQQQDAVFIPSHVGVINELNQQLPNYMVPRKLLFLEALPLTANGKIDRRSLTETLNRLEKAANADTTNVQSVELRKLTPNEKLLSIIWQEILGVEAVRYDDNFFYLGGDSLAATRCIGALKKHGYEADLGVLFKEPCLSTFALTLKLQDPTLDNTDTTIIANSENRYQGFPLTDVQQAYWIGRRPGFVLSGIGSHFFIEFAVDEIDLAEFDRAWNQLVQRHEMLRTVIRDHQQYVLQKVPAFTTRVYSVEGIDSPSANKIRQRQSHQILDPAVWPVFDVQILHTQDHQYRVLISLDNMFLDGLSMQIVLSELQALYRDRHTQLPSINVSFRDYVMTQNVQNNNKNSSAKQTAQDYWREQVIHLPDAPLLPLQTDPATIISPQFIRTSAALDHNNWQQLKTRAQQHQLTPSIILVAAYSAVLSVWSRQTALTVNLTLFDRQPLHDDINHILGDFTSLMLLPWSRNNPDGKTQTWLQNIEKLQQTSIAGLKHSQISAVWVMRELAKQRQQADAAMPVVFTSALGANDERFLSKNAWLQPIGGISQTPQIWLDHQVYESDGELRFNWDAVEALLPRHLLEAMFNDYCKLLERLASDPSIWHQPINETLLALENRQQVQEVQRVISAKIEPVEAPSENITLDNHLTNYSHEDKENKQVVVDEVVKGFTEITSLLIKPSDNFFEAGANSLMLVQLHIYLQNMGYKTLDVTDLFSYSSPATLAKHIAESFVTHNVDESALSTIQPAVQITIESEQRQQRHQKNRDRRRQLAKAE